MTALRKFVLLAAIVASAPAAAKWTTQAPAATRVAGALTVTPASADWNRYSRKPIKKAEIWSLDGPALNTLEFLGGIASGEPLAREIDKKRQPLPKFAADMKATDVADMIERTLRATEHTPDVVLSSIEPADFAGHKGFRLRYRYTVDELTKLAECRGAIVAGRLYLIAYSAPATYYFEAGLPKAQAIMDSAKIG